MSLRPAQSAVLFLCTCLALVAIRGERAVAQQLSVAGPSENGRYYGSGTPVVEQKSIARQKAEARAKQRTARLEAHRWLGYSPNRPPSSPIPFTSPTLPRRYHSYGYRYGTGYYPYLPRGGSAVYVFRPDGSYY